MITIKNKLLFFYRAVVNSIAFYPALIAFGGLLLAFITLAFENYGITKYLLEQAPALVINNADTARSLLGTLIGGLLSLMVFSFSMVMVVLNQASTSFSPRLLPGLISNKKHQIVLGFYLGSLIFNILIAQSVLPEAGAYQLPGFSVLLAIMLDIFCLCLFIYFIDSISNEIQIGNILKGIFKDTRARLVEVSEKEERSAEYSIPDMSEWQKVFSDESGYFQGISKSGMTEIAKEHNTVLHVIPPKGFFILKGIPIIKSEKKLDEDTLKEVRSCIEFSGNETVSENYVLGLKQITEIAIKAMSPGINDPGTALNAIDYLTELLVMRMKLNDEEIYKNEDGKTYLILRVVTFEDLLYNIMASLRQYSKHDVIIMQKLLRMFDYLLLQTKEKEASRKVLLSEINRLLEDIELNIENGSDRAKLINIGEKLIE